MNLAVSADTVTTAAAADDPAQTRAGVIRTLFDRTFYLATYSDVASARLDPLQHFLESGMNEGRSPHPVFDPAFYAAQMPPEAAGEAPFLHYLRCGALNRLDPHPLFDTAHYIAQNEAGTLFGQLPLLHFLTVGTRAQLSPNPLFDTAYYRRANRLGFEHPRHPLLHYIEDGWREGCRTHPLFDPSHYLRLRPDIAQAGVDPLAHYLRQGRLEAASPHELFDGAHYRAAFADQPAELRAIDEKGPVIHYALRAQGRLPSPHPLFDRDFYARRHGMADRAQSDPFLRFLEDGIGHHHDPHPLFDGDFYARRYPDVASPGTAPFLHFVRHGAREARDPNAYFDAARYLSRHPEASDQPYGAISHYLGSATKSAPSPRFDPVFYADCLDAAGVPCGDDPFVHFMSVGRAAGYAPLPRPLTELAWRGTWSPPGLAALRPVLLISPDASRQPVTLCALRAAQGLAADPDLACHVALLRGGVLAAEFAAAAPTVLLDGQREMVELLHAFRRDAPEGIVIVNTATMPGVVALAGRLGLRLLAWLHEMPVSIDSLLGGAATMRSLAAAASRIIAVSTHARAALCQHYGLASDRLVVLGNGVDRRTAQDDARDTAIAVREELGMPPDALLVLGGGPVDFRRGPDLFIKVAQRVVFEGARAHEPLHALAQAHFVWIGDEADRLFSGLCRHDVQQLGLSERVRLLSGPGLMQRLLAAADVFLMTSRAEAFDGDGMQASHSGLPVIAFAGCVDPADLMTGQGSTVVPYLDVEAMAGAVMKLGNRPARRQHRAAALQAAIPTWVQWHDGLRRILEQDFGLKRRPD